MYGKMQESGLTEIIPLMCTTSYPVLSHLESARGASLGVATVADCLMEGIPFPS